MMISAPSAARHSTCTDTPFSSAPCPRSLANERPRQKEDQELPRPCSRRRGHFFPRFPLQDGRGDVPSRERLDGGGRDHLQLAEVRGFLRFLPLAFPGGEALRANRRV